MVQLLVSCWWRLLHQSCCWWRLLHQRCKQVLLLGLLMLQLGVLLLPMRFLLDAVLLRMLGYLLLLGCRGLLLLLRMGVLLLPLLSLLRELLLRLWGHLLLLHPRRVVPLSGHILRLSRMRTLLEGPAIAQRNEVLVGDEVACLVRCGG